MVVVVIMVGVFVIIMIIVVLAVSVLVVMMIIVVLVVRMLVIVMIVMVFVVRVLVIVMIIMVFIVGMLVIMMIVVVLVVSVLVIMMVVMVTVGVFVIMMIVIMVFIVLHSGFDSYLGPRTAATVKRKKLIRLAQLSHCRFDLCFLFVGTRLMFKAHQIVPGGFEFQKDRAVIQCDVQKCGAVFMAIKIAFGLCDAHSGGARHCYSECGSKFHYVVLQNCDSWRQVADIVLWRCYHTAAGGPRMEMARVVSRTTRSVIGGGRCRAREKTTASRWSSGRQALAPMYAW
jgi:hypothetical protein